MKRDIFHFQNVKMSIFHSLHTLTTEKKSITFKTNKIKGINKTSDKWHISSISKIFIPKKMARAKKKNETKRNKTKQKLSTKFLVRIVRAQFAEQPVNCWTWICYRCVSLLLFFPPAKWECIRRSLSNVCNFIHHNLSLVLNPMPFKS